MSSDDPLRAIALAVCATVLFGSSDTISKYLSDSLPIIEFIWIRYAVFLVMALCLIGRHPTSSVRSRNPRLQVVRGLCVVGSSVLFVYGVHQMTMAQATTISFLSPLLITVLSIPLLGIIPESEEVLRASNLGAPVTLNSPGSAPARAYFDAARRLKGEKVEIVVPMQRNGIMSKLFGRRVA